MSTRASVSTGASTHAIERRGGTRGIRRIRLDIEGLRAVAVLSVLVYHLQPSWLPGGFAGVDIFFVISGFLITSHLIREADSTGTISLRSFYARRIMRLIPASTVVLLTTVAGVVMLAPRIIWNQVGVDVIAASAYVLNWVLAARSVDYLAEDSTASPVQHFWSLGVEEQFYLFWPLLILCAIVIAKLVKGGARGLASAAAGLVLIASLGFAIYQWSVGDVSAYFATTTRLWELAAGALVALNIARIRALLPRTLRGIVITASLAAIAWTLVGVDSSSWPSPQTIIPIVAISAIIAWGGNESATLSERVLSLRPLVWIGGISYSVYLWHWPLIVVAGYRWATLPLAVSIAIVVASIGLAWATARLVETPLRQASWFKNRPTRSFGFGALALVVSGTAGLGLVLGGPSDVLKPPAGAVALGAASLRPPIEIRDQTSADLLSGVTWATPSPLEATADVPAIYTDGCQQDTISSEPISCEYGDLGSDRVVALVGDSKAGQWMPALATIAETNGFRLVTYLKSSCALADAPITRDGELYSSCGEWNRNVMSQLAALRPEVTVTSQVRGDALETSGTGASRERMVEGLERTWTAIGDLGSKLVVIGDTPQVGSNVYECVAENSEDLDACSYLREPAIAASALPAQEQAIGRVGGVVIPAGGQVDLADAPTGSKAALLDVNDIVCPAAERCPPIVGNVLIYRSGSHITKTYVETMTELLSASFASVLR
ncbi:acyltransferase family protein [Brevibacterium sediminis]|uniref:acyltransferase family protein n=1 Tax=Brevibacterium sediminis TaxID=1857024 RepID=UPI003B3B0BD2